MDKDKDCPVFGNPKRKPDKGMITRLQELDLTHSLSFDDEKIKHLKEQSQTTWQRLNEVAVPTGTFGEGEEGMRTLRVARTLLFCLYGLLGVVFFCTMVTIILGR